MGKVTTVSQRWEGESGRSKGLTDQTVYLQFRERLTCLKRKGRRGVKEKDFLPLVPKCTHTECSFDPPHTPYLYATQPIPPYCSCCL